MLDMEMLVSEIDYNGAIHLKNCSDRTLQRWVKSINDYLCLNDFEWRVMSEIKDKKIVVVY